MATKSGNEICERNTGHYDHSGANYMPDPCTKSDVYHAIDNAMNEHVSPLKTTLFGPVGEPQKGHEIRMDRVERIAKMLVWGLGLIISAFVCAGAANLISKIFP